MDSKIFLNNLLKKRLLILILSDILFVNFAILLSFSLRLPTLKSYLFTECLWIFPLATLISIPFYIFTNHYKEVLRFAGIRSINSLIVRNIFLSFVIFFLGSLLNFTSPPRSIFILFFLLLTTIKVLAKFIFKDLFLFFKKDKFSQIMNVAIYGAGSGGAQLYESLKLDKRYFVDFFIDDNPNMKGRFLDGVKIFSFPWLEKNFKRVDKIFVAIPSLKDDESRVLLEKLQKLSLPVLRTPSILDITNGNQKITNLNPFPIEVLLSRKPVKPIPELYGPSIRNKNILVTGAGGSIGSELCQLIVKLQPKKLVLLERNEACIYKIFQELNTIKYTTNSKIEIISILGCSTNKELIERTIIVNQINNIFHAAAYKHVPIVESNPIVGIFNNVISTKVICDLSIKNKVEKVILISTDKAVRPTNIMGASKRVAELIIQYFASKYEKADKKSEKTIFSLVRFGNVIGSSGSVVPLFKKQIREGGPITITDPNIIRYFMSIKEASQLVIQASQLAKGGDLFLLDMGKPLKILDLAQKMVILSGKQIKNKNMTGDSDGIEIKFIGLRPGEKLYEELLINSEAKKTLHPLIFKAEECFMEPFFFEKKFKQLEKYLYEFNEKETLLSLKELVPEWSEFKSQ